MTIETLVLVAVILPSPEPAHSRGAGCGSLRSCVLVKLGVMVDISASTARAKSYRKLRRFSNVAKALLPENARLRHCPIMRAAQPFRLEDEPVHACTVSLTMRPSSIF